MDNSTNFKINALLIFVCVVIILEIGQIISGLQLKTNNSQNQNSALPKISSPDSKLLTTQNAIIKGKIIKVNNDKITVENDNRTSGEVPLSKIVLINTSDKIDIASNSADFKKIQLNKPVQINLLLINDTYKITSITYLR